MANEVFSIDIDLKPLQEALRTSEKIRENLSGNGRNGKGILDGIQKSNKALKVQNTLLKTSYKTLQLIKLTMKGIAGGILGLGALGLSGFANATQNNRKFRTIGINERQGYSLDFASEMAGLNKDSLTNAAGALQEALRDVNKLGSLATLGLDTKSLKNKNPVDALFEVMQKTGEHSFRGTLAENVIKEAFDNVVGGYEEFRTLMGDNVNELKGYFAEGKRIYKDNYGNLKKGDQAIIRLKNQFNRMRLFIATKLEPVFTKILEKINPLIEKMGDKLGDAVSKATSWFLQINKETGKTNLDQLFENMRNFANNMARFWEKIKPILAPLGESLVKVANLIIDNPFTESETSKENWKKLESQRAALINKWISSHSILNLQERDAEILELIQKAKAKYEAGELRKGAYNDYVKKFRRWYSGNLNEYQVNDAVITKRGDIVKTSPQDYIFATKNPQALAGAGGGNFTININANVRNDNDIQKIKYELNRLIKSFNVNR